MRSLSSLCLAIVALALGCESTLGAAAPPAAVPTVAVRSAPVRRPSTDEGMCTYGDARCIRERMLRGPEVFDEPPSQRPVGSVDRVIAGEMSVSSGVFVHQGARVVPFSALATGVPIVARDGRCYSLVFRFRGATFSQLARRTLINAALYWPRGGLVYGTFHKYEDGGVAREMCVQSDGPATLRLSLREFGGSPYAGELGDGDGELTIFERASNAANYTAQELAALAAERTRTFSTEPALSTVGDLANTGALSLRTRYDECFVAVMTLDPGATFASNAAPAMALVGPLREDQYLRDPGRFGPGGVFDLGCPLQNGAPSLSFTYRSLGTGAYHLNVYRRRAPAAELAERSGWSASAFASASSFAREVSARVRRSCAQCLTNWRTCRAAIPATACTECGDNERSCDGAREDCLRAEHLSERVCRWPTT